MKKMLKNVKGLTLVELLAVIVILGVIAAIAVPSINGVISSSKTRADAQTVELIEDAAYKYAVAEELTAASTTVTIATLVSSGYLKETPTVQSDTAKTYSDVTITVATGGAITVVVTAAA